MGRIREINEYEERFCEHYSIHKKPAAAYRFAYDCTKWSAESVSAEAYKIRQRPVVVLRLYELATARDQAFKVTMAQKKQWLKDIIEVSLAPCVDEKTKRKGFVGDSKAAIAAISELNKMDGDLAAIRKEVSGLNGGPIVTRSMTADEYKLARAEMLKTDDC